MNCLFLDPRTLTKYDTHTLDSLHKSMTMTNFVWHLFHFSCYYSYILGNKMTRNLSAIPRFHDFEWGRERGKEWVTLLLWSGKNEKERDKSSVSSVWMSITDKNFSLSLYPSSRRIDDRTQMDNHCFELYSGIREGRADLQFWKEFQYIHFQMKRFLKLFIPIIVSSLHFFRLNSLPSEKLLNIKWVCLENAFK